MLWDDMSLREKRERYDNYVEHMVRNNLTPMTFEDYNNTMIGFYFLDDEE